MRPNAPVNATAHGVGLGPRSTATCHVLRGSRAMGLSARCLKRQQRRKAFVRMLADPSDRPIQVKRSVQKLASRNEHLWLATPSREALTQPVRSLAARWPAQARGGSQVGWPVGGGAGCIWADARPQVASAVSANFSIERMSSSRLRRVQAATHLKR